MRVLAHAKACRVESLTLGGDRRPTQSCSLLPFFPSVTKDGYSMSAVNHGKLQGQVCATARGAAEAKLSRPLSSYLALTNALVPRTQPTFPLMGGPSFMRVWDRVEDGLVGWVENRQYSGAVSSLGCRMFLDIRGHITDVLADTPRTYVRGHVHGRPRARLRASTVQSQSFRRHTIREPS